MQTRKQTANTWGSGEETGVGGEGARDGGESLHFSFLAAHVQVRLTSPSRFSFPGPIRFLLPDPIRFSDFQVRSHSMAAWAT